MNRQWQWGGFMAALLISCTAQAQESQNNEAAQADASTEASVNNTNCTGESCTKPAEQAQTEPQPCSGGNCEKKETQTEPAPATKSSTDSCPGDKNCTAAHESSNNESLPKEVSSQVYDQEARMAAMKELSTAFPASAANNAAQAVVPKIPEKITIKRLPAPQATQSMPILEHHGYFRTRLEYLGNYDLDTRGTSPIAAPIGSRERGAAQQTYFKAKKDDALLGADMRFRYTPILHVSETLMVAGTFDFFDNMAFGTTSANAANGWGRDKIYSFNGVSEFGASSAISVKALYGQADTLLGRFRVGRMPVDWGLGIMYNDGGQYHYDDALLHRGGWTRTNADAGDYYDRVEYTLREPFLNLFYLQFAWDFSNSGISTKFRTHDNYRASFDLTESDDVIQFELALFDKPLTRKEIDQRRHALRNVGDKSLDWGFLFSYREQKSAADPQDPSLGTGNAAVYQLYTQRAKLYVLNGFATSDFILPYDLKLHLGAEAIAAFGSIRYDKAVSGNKQNIIDLGLALESELNWKNDLYARVKTGFAWSKEAKFAGYPTIDKDPTVPRGSNFRFDPSYIIDSIMFKTLMGGICNAYYLNLDVDYSFPFDLGANNIQMGTTFLTTTSFALKPSATPGDNLWYGLEAQLGLFYREKDRFSINLFTGLFAPGRAWDRLRGSVYPVLPASNVYEDDISAAQDYSAHLAWTVQSHITWMF